MNEILLAERIRQLRKNAGLTQQQVSAMLHIRRQSYSNYETCRRNPPVTVLAALSRIYQIPVDYFVCDEEELRPVSLRAGRKPPALRMSGNGEKLSSAGPEKRFLLERE